MGQILKMGCVNFERAVLGELRSTIIIGYQDIRIGDAWIIDSDNITSLDVTVVVVTHGKLIDISEDLLYPAGFDGVSDATAALRDHDNAFTAYDEVTVVEWT